MKKLAHETILERMKENIIVGVWKPGERLPTLQQLAEEFGLSVTAVREALRIMESQGIISIEHGRGMFVRNDPALLDDPAFKIRSMEEGSLLHLIEARMVIEPELAAMCAVRGGPQIRKKLSELAALMEVQMEQGGDFFTTDLDYHHTIAEGADNPVLAEMLFAISDLSAAGRRETNKLPNMRAKAASYHRLIALAISERQADQARSLMKAHLEDMILSIKNSKLEQQ